MKEYTNVNNIKHMKHIIHFFHKKLRFEPINPLDDGLGDDIVAEQHEPQAIHLDQGDDVSVSFWDDASIDE